MITVVTTNCPNDQFIVYGWKHHHITAPPATFETDDLESINQRAVTQRPDLVKASIAAWPQLQRYYHILPSGGASVWGHGPLLLTRKETTFHPEMTIGSPGPLTTAERLRKEFYPQSSAVYHPADRLLPLLASGELEAIVAIHQHSVDMSQFTCVANLGVLWKKKYHLPLPLGAFFLNRQSATHFAPIVTALQTSLAWGFAHKNKILQSLPHPKEAAAHIQSFVNQETLQFSQKSYQAITKLTRRLP